MRTKFGLLSVALLCTFSVFSAAKGQDSFGTPIPDAVEALEQAGDDASEQKIKVYTVSELAEAGGKPPSIDNTPDEPDLSALFAHGIQGEVLVEFTVAIDGTVDEASVKVSSGSSALDEVAISLVSQFSGQAGRDNDGEPVAVRAEYPLQFWKDSILDGTLEAKTCADFVTDADWFLQVNPEAGIDEMRVWKMTVGLLSAGSLLQGKGAAVPDAQEVYDMCSRRPSRKFLKAYQRSL